MKPDYHVRIAGSKYGPYSREEVLKYLREQPLSLDPEKFAVFDPVRNQWIASAIWAESQPEFEKTDEGDEGIVWRGISVTTTYSRVTIAGVILLVLFGSAYLAVGLTTGNWPGRGAPRHHNPMPADFDAPADTTEILKLDRMQAELLRRSPPQQDTTESERLDSLKNKLLKKDTR